MVEASNATRENRGGGADAAEDNTQLTPPGRPAETEQEPPIRRYSLRALIEQVPKLGEILEGKYTPIDSDQDIFSDRPQRPTHYRDRKNSCLIGQPSVARANDESLYAGLIGVSDDIPTDLVEDFLKGFASWSDANRVSHAFQAHATDTETRLAQAINSLNVSVATQDDLTRARAQLFETILDTISESRTGHAIRLEDTPPEGYSFKKEAISPPQVAGYHREGQNRLLDKVGMRNFLEDSGLLQPRYLDARAANGPQSFRLYSKVDFNNIPLEQMVKKDECPKHWVIENLTSGLCVYNDGGVVFVISANPRILQLIVKHQLHTPSSDVTTQKLKAFFTDVAKLDNLFARDLKPDTERADLNPEQLAKLILSHNSPVYIKSSRTAGGKSVVRVSRDDDGNAVLECDGPELGQLVKAGLDALNKSMTSEVPLKVFINRAAMSLTPEKLLAKLIENMESPIAEEEIPMLLIGGGRAEPRIIYQESSSGEIERQGAYCKKSESRVTANISLGGSGISIDEALRMALSDVISADELESEVAAARDELFRTCDAAAKKLHDSASGIFRDFAIDVGLVWNETANKLDLYLVEVQKSYKFTGLQFDNDACLRIEGNKARLANSKAITPAKKLLGLLGLALDSQSGDADSDPN